MSESKELVVVQRDIADAVTEKINVMTAHGDLALPEGYNVGNALKCAMFKLQGMSVNNKSVFEVCTKTSIANSLLNMAVQGLSPERNQCYFIPYGNELQLQRSYFGTIAALKRANPDVYKVVCEIAHQDDQIRWGWTDAGERYVICIDTDPLTNRDKPFAVGFCNIFSHDGDLIGYTVMTWQEIQKSWRQSKTYKDGGTSPHSKFPEEMAKRTLIAKACKLLLNSSTSDGSNSEIIKAFNQTTEAEYDNDNDNAQKTVVKPLSKAEAIKAKYVVKDEPKAQEMQAVPEEQEEQTKQEEPTGSPEDFVGSDLF